MGTATFYLIASVAAVLAWRYRKRVIGFLKRLRSTYYVRVAWDRTGTGIRAYHVGRGDKSLFVFHPEKREELPELRLAIETELARSGYVEVLSGLWRYKDDA